MYHSAAGRACRWRRAVVEGKQVTQEFDSAHHKSICGGCLVGGSSSLRQRRGNSGGPASARTPARKEMGLGHVRSWKVEWVQERRFKVWGSCGSKRRRDFTGGGSIGGQRRSCARAGRSGGAVITSAHSARGSQPWTNGHISASVCVYLWVTGAISFWFSSV
jgi:hypothetical protein